MSMQPWQSFTGAAVVLAFAAVPLLAGDVTIPHSFTSGSTASAAEVNANFAAVADEINDNDLRLDDLESGRFSNGSAGDLVIAASSTVNWRLTPPPGNNLQFRNCTIDSGATLIVPSGTVIRCRGSFVNNGLIQVRRHTLSGIVFADQQSPAHPGIAARAAQGPGVGTANLQAGGEGGWGIGNAFSAAQVLHPGVIGGGSGTGFPALLSTLPDHHGGGTFTVLAEEGIRNTGHIEASGANAVSGFGGGGGGVVILASRVEVDNSTGTVFAHGGNGGASDSQHGPGGGGGGGIVHFIAPLISGAANTSIGGGPPGAVTGPVTTAPYAGGGGGGASAGDGGRGSNADLNATPNAASAGDDGYVLETVADPVALF